jgi:hypothetical protein
MNERALNGGSTISPLLPTLLMGISLLVMLSWQVFLGVRQYQVGQDVERRQDALLAQAAQAEEFLQGLMLDLIELAKTDPAARDIVQRYNISFTPPLAPGAEGAAVPAPAAAP